MQATAPQRPLFSIASLLGPTGGDATPAQIQAIRYWIDDWPTDAPISYAIAQRLLSCRSYLIALIAGIERRGRLLDPLEATRVYLDRLGDRPDMVDAIYKWGADRWREDRGPPRVGGTVHAEELRAHLLRWCTQPPPSQQALRTMLRNRLSQAGLTALVDHCRLTLTYDSSGEITKRVVSDFTLRSAWPEWSVIFLDPLGFTWHLDGYCHLRSERRTFSLGRVVAATGGDISARTTNI